MVEEKIVVTKITMVGRDLVQGRLQGFARDFHVTCCLSYDNLSLDWVLMHCKCILSLCIWIGSAQGALLRLAVTLELASLPGPSYLHTSWYLSTMPSACHLELSEQT